MQSHSIDVIIWESDEDNAIVASAVSPEGLTFIRSLATQEDVSAIIVISGPEEFLQGIPPGLEVAYNRGDGNIIRIDNVQLLQ